MLNSIRGRLCQTAIAAAAALTVSLAAPVQANPTDSTTANASNTAQQRTPAAQRERRICVEAENTGTRVPRRICRTRAEWEREGGVPSND
jgi:hypothetical protein